MASLVHLELVGLFVECSSAESCLISGVNHLGSCSEEALKLGVEISLALIVFLNFQRNSGLVSKWGPLAGIG